MPDEESLFDAARKLPPGDERYDLLERECGDDAELRAKVEWLLKNQDAAGSFLEQLPSEVRPLDVKETVHLNSTDDTAKSGELILPTTTLPELEPCDTPGRIGKLGDYEVIELIGQGGMGSVLRAWDAKLHREVALKLMSLEMAANSHARERFLREARSAAAVIHDHVVTIYSIEDARHPPLIAMECVEGETLQQKIAREGALPIDEVVHFGKQMAAGLAAAHAEGLIHRDIKPANVLLEESTGRALITDFGLARAADSLELTQSGMILGTPQYMSPEQARGEAIDARSDLFSLGSVLYTMCTGEPAFPSENLVGALHRVCHESPLPVRRQNAKVPRWLETVISCLMAKDRDDRIQTCEELRQAFERAAPLVTLKEKRLARRLRVVVGILALTVVGVTSVLLRTSSETPKPILITPTSVMSSTASTDSGAASNLIDSSGLSFPITTENYVGATHAAVSRKNCWFTRNPGGRVTDYFANTDEQPTLSFLLPRTENVSGIVMWGYHFQPSEADKHTSEAKSFTISFSIDGGSTFGTSFDLIHDLSGPAADTIWLPKPVQADAVRIQFTDNYYGQAGYWGGGRVGLGEVRFLASQSGTNQLDDSRRMLHQQLQVAARKIAGGSGTSSAEVLVSGEYTWGPREKVVFAGPRQPTILANPWISPNESRMYFQARDPIIGSDDILVSRRAEDGQSWLAPTPLGETINTEHHERFPSLSADGKRLVFSSNRPGGIGGFDLWLAERDTVDDSFREPMNLGAPINSPQDETAVCLKPDGQLIAANVVSEPGQAKLFFAEGATSGAPFQKLNAPPMEHLGVRTQVFPSFTSDETAFLYSIGKDGVVLHDEREEMAQSVIWDVADGLQGPIYSPFYSHRSRTLYFSASDRENNQRSLWMRRRVKKPAAP